MYETIGGRIVSDPIELIQERSRRWMLLWSKHEGRYHELAEAIQTVARMARNGEELPEVTAAELVKAIASIKKDAALGPDRLSPRELRRLPLEGIDALLKLYHGKRDMRP